MRSTRNPYHHSFRNRIRGAVLIEAFAAICVILPLILLTVVVIVETAQAFTIHQAMNQGAYLAARGLAVYYKTNPEVVNTPSEQQAIFSQIRLPNMISSNAQFSIPSGNSGWNTNGTPPTVTVICSYLSGQGSPALPTFPYPDPLHIASSITISASATCALVQ